MRIIVFALFALLGTAFAVPNSSNRIVGGEGTTVERYPYMTNMQYLWFNWYWMQSCGGSLLTSSTVLSAAHCYVGDSPSSWRVRVGTSQAESGGTVITVSQLIVHERYNDFTIDNDVAIVRLSSSATLGGSIGVARIAGPNYNLPDGTVVTAIGWGSLSSGGSYPDQLQHVDINTISQQICFERYEHLKTQPGYQSWPSITDGMLCAGILDVGGKDACQGDSGGPLAYSQDILVGVTSWGFGCAHNYYPGVNARVSYFSDWIVANGSS